MPNRDSVQIINTAVELHTAHIEHRTADEWRHADRLIELAQEYRGKLFERDG